MRRVQSPWLIFKTRKERGGDFCCTYHGAMGRVACLLNKFRLQIRRKLCTEEFWSNFSLEIPRVRNITHFKMELAKLSEELRSQVANNRWEQEVPLSLLFLCQISNTLLPCVFLFTQWYQCREEESVQEVEVLNSVTNYIRYDSSSQLAELRFLRYSEY